MAGSGDRPAICILEGLTIQQAAAVNDDFRTYRPARLVGSQIQHGFGHLVGRTEAAKRNARRNIFVDLLAVRARYSEFVVQRCLDRSRAI